MALSEVSYSFRICVNSVMSEVNIGVVSKMKTCQFVPLLPSHYAMTPPFTIMTSQVDCRSLVYEAGLQLLLPVFSYPHPSGTFLSTSYHYFLQYSFSKSSHHPTHPCHVLSPFLPQMNSLSGLHILVSIIGKKKKEVWVYKYIAD